MAKTNCPKNPEPIIIHLNSLWANFWHIKYNRFLSKTLIEILFLVRSLSDYNLIFGGNSISNRFEVGRWFSKCDNNSPANYNRSPGINNQSRRDLYVILVRRNYNSVRTFPTQWLRLALASGVGLRPAAVQHCSILRIQRYL